MVPEAGMPKAWREGGIAPTSGPLNTSAMMVLRCLMHQQVMCLSCVGVLQWVSART